MSWLKHGWNDQQIDNVIGLILRVGVIVSALVVLSGGILYIIRHPDALPNYRVFRGEPTDLCSLHGIVKEVFALNASGIIQFGLLLLIATPVLRVAFTVVAFAMQKDRTYVVITLFVLALLLYSLTGGRH